MTNSWFLESLETKVEGSASIEWLDDAFLILRSEFGAKERDWTWVMGRATRTIDTYCCITTSGEWRASST